MKKSKKIYILAVHTSQGRKKAKVHEVHPTDDLMDKLAGTELAYIARSKRAAEKEAKSWNMEYRINRCYWFEG